MDTSSQEDLKEMRDVDIGRLQQTHNVRTAASSEKYFQEAASVSHASKPDQSSCLSDVSKSIGESMRALKPDTARPYLVNSSVKDTLNHDENLVNASKMVFRSIEVGDRVGCDSTSLTENCRQISETEISEGSRSASFDANHVQEPNKQYTTAAEERSADRVVSENHNDDSIILIGEDKNNLLSFPDSEKTVVDTIRKVKTSADEDHITTDNINIDNNEVGATSILLSENELTRDNDVNTSTDMCVHVSAQETDLLLDNEYCGSSLAVTSELEDQAEDTPACRSPESSVSAFSKEATYSPSSADFQPIILDVRGGYTETEIEDESEKTESLVTSEVSQISESSAGKITNTSNNVESVPLSAFELLQDMVHHAFSANQGQQNMVQHTLPSIQGQRGETSEVKIINASKTCSSFENEIIGSVLPPAERVYETHDNCNSKRSNNHQTEISHCSTNPTLSIRTTDPCIAPNKPTSENELHYIPPRVSLSALSVATTVGVTTCQINSGSKPGGSSQLIPSNIIIKSRTGTSNSEKMYSCVFLQDTTNDKQNKVALLIPQSSLPSLSNITTVTPSVPQKIFAADVQTGGKSANTRLTSSTPSSSTLLSNSHTLIAESVSRMIRNTVVSFCLRGIDLKDSDLLEIPKNNNSSESPVKCSVCGEGYNNKEGLDFHLKRTVFYLRFHCKHCKMNLLFYNKCSLYMHLQSELSNPVLNYYDILCFQPYEFDVDNKSKNHNTQMSERPAVGTKKGYFRRAIKSSGSKSQNLPVGTVSVDNSAVSRVNTVTRNISDSPASNVPRNLDTCTICQEKFSNLSCHLSLSMFRKYSCPSCEMFLPTVCAWEAHLKIHCGEVRNMTCPECGKQDFQSAFEGDDMRSVFDHLDLCKHFNRFLAIKCFCGREFSAITQLMEHVAGKHIRTLFKCPFCMLVFTQQGRLEGHLDKVHKIKDIAVRASVICLCCRQILKSPTELRKHVDKHVDEFKNKSSFRWKCFICTKSFINKAGLNKHLEEDHPHKSKRCTICYSLFWSRKNLVEHIVQKKCSRSLAQRLNVCVDMQAEIPEKVLESVNFNKLFEIKQTAKAKSDDGQQRQVAFTLTSKEKQLCFVSILPKSTSDQLGTDKQNSQPNLQQHRTEKIFSQLTKPHSQAVSKVSSSNNSITDTALPHPVKIVIAGTTGTILPWKGMTTSAVTHCDVCKKLIDSTKFTDHLKSHQQQQQRDFISKAKITTNSEMSSQRVHEGEEGQKELVSECSRDGETLVRVDENKQLGTEPGGQQKGETDSRNTDNPTHVSVFPCLLCGLAFQSSYAKDEHVSRSHDGTRIVYHCVVCKRRGKNKIFTKKELASRHITKKHRIVKMDTVNRLIRTEEQNVSSGQKLPAPNETEGPSAPKRLRVAGEGDYMCGKCGFSSACSQDFSQHITSHNSANEPQCPECGLCFTVFLALKKHLLAVHKIRDVDNYLEEQNIEEPKLEEEEMDLMPEIHPFNKPELRSMDSNNDRPNTATKISYSNPLECTVCYKVFDIEANLKTHMRNHGMAFIRSKRHKL